jgi:hypothetical protein
MPSSSKWLLTIMSHHQNPVCVFLFLHAWNSALPFSNNRKEVKTYEDNKGECLEACRGLGLHREWKMKRILNVYPDGILKPSPIICIFIPHFKLCLYFKCQLHELFRSSIRFKLACDPSGEIHHCSTSELDSLDGVNCV